MATVQSQLFKLALRVDPATKYGKRIQGDESALTISGTSNNTGLIRVTVTTAHGLSTGDLVHIKNVVNVVGGGSNEANNTIANPVWTITSISTYVFDLQSSTYVNAGTGGTAVAYLVGSVDGKFPRQRLLDIYNEARVVLIGLMEKYVPSLSARLLMVSENIVPDYVAAFTSAKVSLPAGYVAPVSLRSSANLRVPIVPMGSVERLRSLSSASNPFVWQAVESGVRKLVAVDATAVPNGNYSLTYYGVADWTLANVTAGTAVETFKDTLLPVLIDIAEAIANEQGNAAVEGVFSKFIGSAQVQ
jgi:hypothetical protein